MKASINWHNATGDEFGIRGGRAGCGQLRGYSVSYREWGRGTPLVLVPGLAGGVRLLGPLIQTLARDFRVISYQLRGEDDCFALRRPFGLADLVSDLAEFLDWHRLERPVVMGVSFGGVLALELATRLPSRVGSLVVQGVSARFERGLVQRVAGSVLAGYPLPDDNPFVNQFFNLLFGGSGRPEGLFRFVTRQCWQTDQGVIAHRFRMLESFDVTGRLQRVTAPALILAGDRDLLVSEAALQDLHRGLPASRLVRLKGCGHLACVTHPDRIAEAVRDFCREPERVAAS